MGWGFRRSFAAGGVRFTLSQSGVSTSMGGKGFRIATGPRGVYVTTGLGGFYYRQRLGGPRPRPVSVTPPPRGDTTSLYYATEHIESAGVEHLTDVSQDEFVSSLNEWTRRGALQILTVVAVAALWCLLLAVNASPPAFAELATYGVIAFLLARFVEHRRRRFLLVYDLGPGEAQRYQRLTDALAELSGSSRFRAVKMIGHHHDWKRNAGATKALTFEPASLKSRVPPHIVTNLVPWALTLQGMQLYFFPDRVLIRSRGRFAALSYQALEVDTYTSNFVWDEAVPRDAQVVGQTWLYVRRDGGPDRRFNGNRQIPLVRTAYLTFKSSTGLEAVVQTTRIRAAEQWEQAARAYARESSTPARASVEADPQIQQAILTLGLGALPSAAELKNTYRELAQRSHPDRFARSPRDLRLFADQRMQEINAAYALLTERLAAHVPPAEPSSGPAAIPASSGVRPARLSAEAIATLLAGLVALVMFIGFRASPKRAEAPPAPRLAATPVAEAPPPPPPVAAPKRRIVIACPLRAEPSPQGKQLAVIANGAELEMLESRYGWWRVRTGVGEEGWTGPKCWQPPPPKPKVTPRQAGSAAEVAAPAATGGGAPVDPYAEPPTGSAPKPPTAPPEPPATPEPPTSSEPKASTALPEPKDSGGAAPLEESR